MSNLRSALVAVVSASLLAAAATTTGSTPAQAAPGGPTVRPDVAVHPTRVGTRTGAADLTAAAAGKATPRAVWPAPRTSTARLTDASAAGRTPARGVAAPAPSLARSWVSASGTPVMVARSARGKGPSSVRATVLPQKAAQAAGVPGVLLRVANASGPAGSVDVRVSYAAFATAVGGDWASRLHLVRLPACALTTPTKAACRVQTPLAPPTTPRARPCRHRSH